jgi:predicted transcriptional regulator
MTDKQDILISLASKYAEKIFAGEKQVELRRRAMRVAPGSTVWIYVKLPVGSIVGRARVEAVHASSPASLWRRFGVVSGLSREEFFEYFKGVPIGFALVLEGAKRLRRSLSLDSLRRIAEGFNPPQFFVRLTAEHPLFSVVTTAISRSR